MNKASVPQASELVTFLDNLVKNQKHDYFVRWWVTPTNRIYFDFVNLSLVGYYWLDGSVNRRGRRRGDEQLTIGQVRYRIRKANDARRETGEATPDRSGATIESLVEKYGLGYAYIYEHLKGMYPDNPRLYKRRSGELSNSKDNMLLILAQLINTDRALEAIGNDFGVTRQYVCRILVAARNAGIGVHPARERRRRGAC